MTKTRLHFVSVALSCAFAAFSAQTALADGDACEDARKRLSWMPAMFAKNNKCDLAIPKYQEAVRAETPAVALANFRALKADWMAHFDKSKEDTLGAGLDSLSKAASEFISKHPERGEMNEHLKDLVKKIAALNTAVDNMRPDGATNTWTLTAIDRALGDLQFTCTQDRDDSIVPPICTKPDGGRIDQLDDLLQNEEGTKSDPELAELKAKVHGIHLSDTAVGLDWLRNVQICRINDAQVKKDRVTVNNPPCNGAVVTESSSSSSGKPALNLDAYCALSPLSAFCLKLAPPFGQMSFNQPFGLKLDYPIKPFSLDLFDKSSSANVDTK